MKRRSRKRKHTDADSPATDLKTENKKTATCDSIEDGKSKNVDQLSNTEQTLIDKATTKDDDSKSVKSPDLECHETVKFPNKQSGVVPEVNAASTEINGEVERKEKTLIEFDASDITIVNPLNLPERNIEDDEVEAQVKSDEFDKKVKEVYDQSKQVDEDEVTVQTKSEEIHKVTVNQSKQVDEDEVTVQTKSEEIHKVTVNQSKQVDEDEVTVQSKSEEIHKVTVNQGKQVNEDEVTVQSKSEEIHKVTVNQGKQVKIGVDCNVVCHESILEMKSSKFKGYQAVNSTAGGSDGYRISDNNVNPLMTVNQSTEHINVECLDKDPQNVPGCILEKKLYSEVAAIIDNQILDRKISDSNPDNGGNHKVCISKLVADADIDNSDDIIKINETKLANKAHLDTRQYGLSMKFTTDDANKITGEDQSGDSTETDDKRTLNNSRNSSILNDAFYEEGREEHSETANERDTTADLNVESKQDGSAEADGVNLEVIEAELDETGEELLCQAEIEVGMTKVCDVAGENIAEEIIIDTADIERAAAAVMEDIKDEDVIGLQVTCEMEIPDTAVTEVMQMNTQAYQPTCSEGTIMMMPQAVTGDVAPELERNAIDDITDSQLCAIDWSSQFPADLISSMEVPGPSLNPRATTNVIPVRLQNVTSSDMEDGSAIMAGLIKEVAQLNKQLLQTKREIETARRQRQRLNKI